MLLPVTIINAIRQQKKCQTLKGFAGSIRDIRVTGSRLCAVGLDRFLRVYRVSPSSHSLVASCYLKNRLNVCLPLECGDDDGEKKLSKNSRRKEDSGEDDDDGDDHDDDDDYEIDDEVEEFKDSSDDGDDDNDGDDSDDNDDNDDGHSTYKKHLHHHPPAKKSKKSKH